jgi:hypothetical protein
MPITELVALTLAAGLVVGGVVHHRAAFCFALALYAIPVTMVLVDRDAFSQDDTTGVLLAMCALFVLAPAVFGTAVGMGVGRRRKIARTRLRR